MGASQHFNIRVGLNRKTDERCSFIIDGLAIRLRQLQQTRRCLCVLAAQFIVVPDLIQHQLLRVRFLDGIILYLRHFVRRVAGERAIPVRAKLRFVRVNVTLRFMVDGGDFVDLAPAAVRLDR